jgi:outer membrane protein OmpA-like peptidoglycan-associated protein
VADKEHKDGQDHGGGSHGGGGGGHGGGAHGGGAAHEEHEGAPEWLISFADNVALMMGFFVILLAMNMKEPTAGGIGGKEKNGGAPDSRMADLVIGIREAFHRPIDMTSDDPSEAALRKRILEKRLAGESRQPEDAGNSRESQSIAPTELSSLGGNVAFEDEADTLSARSREKAEMIGKRLRGQRWVIEVRGHASPSEVFKDSKKGQDLGHRRAMAVAEVLVEQGVRWQQVRTVSCGDNEQNAKRQYDRDADRVNQRVEIVVTGEQAADEAGASGVSGASAPAAPGGATAGHDER